MLQYINKLSNKQHMIISLDTKKTFYKFQNTFMIKKESLHNVGIEGTNHNIITTRPCMTNTVLV